MTRSGGQDGPSPRAGARPSREKPVPALLRLPRSIWALGFVSLFMDVSSEMIHALLPVFLVTVLGAGYRLDIAG